MIVNWSSGDREYKGGEDEEDDETTLDQEDALVAMDGANAKASKLSTPLDLQTVFLAFKPSL